MKEGDDSPVQNLTHPGGKFSGGDGGRPWWSAYWRGYKEVLFAKTYDEARGAFTRVHGFKPEVLTRFGGVATDEDKAELVRREGT